jgi:hypothetical protein
MTLDLDYPTNAVSFNTEFGEVYRVGNGGSGEDGATFIPTVDVDGIISWENDKGLPNPEPRNIKGQKGDKGDKGEDGYTPIKGVDYFDGVKGDPFTYEDFTTEQLEALKGKDGQDYVLTSADKTEIANAVLDALPTWNGGAY